MFAVIGLGPFGESLSLTLAQGGARVLGIDDDVRRVQHLSSQIDCVILDPTDEGALREVEITTFDAVVVALGADFERAVLTTAALKSLGVKYVICQSMTADHQQQILARVGADRVVEPQSEASLRLACELMASPTGNKLPTARQQDIVKLQIPEALAGSSLAQLAPDIAHDLTQLVIRRGDEFLLWPPVETSWSAADLIVVMGREKALAALTALLLAVTPAPLP